jgi:hypothetical protein
MLTISTPLSPLAKPLENLLGTRDKGDAGFEDQANSAIFDYTIPPACTGDPCTFFCVSSFYLPSRALMIGL